MASRVRIPGGRPPEKPGVYIMKSAEGKVLYIGKAVNLKRRVESYFKKAARLPADRQDSRIEALVRQIKSIDYRITDSAVEALLLEAKLIRRYAPRFNIKEKDDKSFLCVGITKEKFPRVLVVRCRDITEKVPAPSLTEHLSKRPMRKHEGRSVQFSAGFGPFPSSSQLREALKIIRRIFPWNTHAESSVARRPCFEYQIQLCPGTCIGEVLGKEYAKTIRNIILFLEGKKDRVLKTLVRDMETASKKMEFEKAASLRGKIFALKHIQDVAFITNDAEQITNNRGYESKVISYKSMRIEGYDISNISGDAAVASMVVFVNGKPAKEEYREFRMRSAGPNDVAMIKETISRRFNHKEWPAPGLVVVDGGAGQIRAAREAIRAHGLRVPVIGIAKGPERKRNDIIGILPKGISRETIIRVRDEAHRFAIAYHKKLRSRRFLEKT